MRHERALAFPLAPRTASLAAPVGEAELTLSKSFPRVVLHALPVTDPQLRGLQIPRLFSRDLE
jgi:hypothetical protein